MLRVIIACCCEHMTFQGSQQFKTHMSSHPYSHPSIYIEISATNLTQHNLNATARTNPCHSISQRKRSHNRHLSSSSISAWIHSRQSPPAINNNQPSNTINTVPQQHYLHITTTTKAYPKTNLEHVSSYSVLSYLVK